MSLIRLNQTRGIRFLKWEHHRQKVERPIIINLYIYFSLENRRDKFIFKRGGASSPPPTPTPPLLMIHFLPVDENIITLSKRLVQNTLCLSV